MPRQLFVFALCLLGAHAFTPRVALHKTRLSSSSPAISALPADFWTAGSIALAEKTSDCKCFDYATLAFINLKCFVYWYYIALLTAIIQVKSCILVD